MRLLPALLVLLIAHAVSAAPGVIVLELRARTPGVADAAATLNALLPSEFARVTGTQTITQSELRAILQADALEQLLGCGDDASCTSARLQGVGADRLVTGELAELGAQLVLSLSLVDVKLAKVERRAARVAQGRDGLIAELRVAVQELAGASAKAPQAPPVAVARAASRATALDVVALDGTSSYDPDGQPLTFRWRQLAGPPATLESATQARAGAFVAAPGTYRFGLTVSDGEHASVEETAEVKVQATQDGQAELGLAGLLGTPVFLTKTDDGRPFRQRSVYAIEGGVALSLSRRLRLAVGGGASMLETTPDAGSEDVRVAMLGLLARAGLRYLWDADGFRWGFGADVLLQRGYFGATVERAGTSREDGYHRNVLLGVGALAHVELPITGPFGLYARAGVRWLREATEPFEFDPAFVPVQLVRPFSLAGADLQGGAFVAW